MRHRDLISLFLKIGATGFGGVMPMLALVQEQVVERKKWLSAEEFANGLALAQILPGPIVVDTVAYVGYRLKGWLGAVAATVSFILPSFLLMLVFSIAYLRYGHVPNLAGAFKGIGAAVVALVLVAGYRMGKTAIKSAPSALLAAAGFAAVLWCKVDVALLVIAAGLIGVLVFRGKDGGSP